MTLQVELDLCRELAEEAGKMLILEAQRQGGPRGSGQKADIDDEIDAFLGDSIKRAFPEDTVISEEGGMRPGVSDRVFLIDPHDGTRDFLLGRRETSISIALVIKDTLVLGVVCAPFSTPMTGPNGFLYAWAKGHPLYDGNTPLELPAPPTSLTKDSLSLISTRVQGEKLEQNQRLLAPSRLENCPSIATRLALVAAGKADFGLTIHALSPWDFAGGQALLQGAGGDVFLEDGQPHLWEAGAPKRVGKAYFGARHIPLLKELVGRFQGTLL